MRSLRLRCAVGLASLSLVAACTDDPDRSGERGQPTPTPQPSATDLPAPKEGACYRLPFDEAVAYTTDAPPRKCRRTHTSVTYAVGDIDNVVDGHLVAVDSRLVAERVADNCRGRFGEYVGGSLDQQRLSMLRPVWFTPTVEESDNGAAWYRCDVIAVAGNERLAPLDGEIRGTLETREGRTRWGMCGTAEPGSKGFERVLCGGPHSWRAVEVVTFREEEYPGERAAQARGQQQCEAAGNAAADDPLDFQWGYEWPTEKQWDAGSTYGLCWVPE